MHDPAMSFRVPADHAVILRNVAWAATADKMTGMKEIIRRALRDRDRRESWAYIAQQTGIDRSQLCGFATSNRAISAQKLEILAEYLGLELAKKNSRIPTD